ncbi:SUF system Fe-S cluster assembly regulator [Photobacterium sagamiensis]|uniref:SUF system Fe-S cluster assembly regulator n=1 Tax=Photobacterium sagamiensis TaxID=2910241 RepID=UPI003D124E1B
MLRVSKMTDYGSVLLSYMARYPDQTFSAASLAEAVYLPHATVIKLLKILNNHDLVVSKLGKNGGYRLACPAQQITLAQILGALEGRLGLTECSVKENLCGIESHCEIRHSWKSINQVINAVLTQVTLADMIVPKSLQEARFRAISGNSIRTKCI